LTDEDGVGVNFSCVDNVDDLKFVDKRIQYDTVGAVLEGVYDEKGRIELA
jgi:hypothetical protein